MASRSSRTVEGPAWRRPKAPATEQADLQTALARIPQIEDFMGRLAARMEPAFSLRPPARVLDIGAAQGVTIAALRRRGFDAAGVEPWKPAIEVSHELARATGLEIPIEHGKAESLPFESGSFDFVNAYSVMEHVDDPDAVFREAHRVLTPGGAFFFSTTSALGPRQAEIAGFPLFPWYPPPLQRRIMRWAAERRPWLVGNTTQPAYHWFKHREVRSALEATGFAQVIDRWTLRQGERNGVRGRVIDACASNRAVRLGGDIAVSGMEYLGIKG